MRDLLLSGWTAFAWTIALAWLAILVVFVRAAGRRVCLVPLEDEAALSVYPKLSVVVAARNESGCIETLIRSLMRQDYHDFEVVVVNDRSTDDTGSILERLAWEFRGRLQVEHIASLPTGWFGKPHALTVGMGLAAGDLICFTDADCEFQAPSTLRTTVADMFRRDLHFFTLAAQYTMTSLRERVLVPCCSEALMMWLRPERAENPQTSDAFANGAYILVRRDAFEQIGGWGAVRAQISEDLQLARFAKQSGLRIGVAQGRGFYETREYGSPRDSWNGWSRILKGTLAPWQLTATLVRMTILFLIPLAVLLTGLVTALLTGDVAGLSTGAGLACTLAVGFRTLLDLLMFRLVGSRTSAVFLAPLGRLFVMAAATRALLSQAGLVRTYWRGATFSAGQLITPQSALPPLPAPELPARPVSVPRATA